MLLNDLRESLSGSEIELRREESVGPKIGGELRTAAVNSVVAALALIVLYITVRFVFRYGIAAIMALVHDVTLTLGVFSLLNFEVSLQIIAAFLTIIGYSLNDTIVVFDRIRENMKLRRKESYREVINRSINECLSRTVLTSLTTFFVAAMLYVLRRPGDPRLRLRAVLRRDRRYLQFDVHRQPDPGLVVRAADQGQEADGLGYVGGRGVEGPRCPRGEDAPADYAGPPTPTTLSIRMKKAPR